MFRTQGGDFSFPYPQSGRDVEKTKKKVWNDILNTKRKYPVSWLIEKFSPVQGWTQEDIIKLKEGEKQ